MSEIDESIGDLSSRFTGIVSEFNSLALRPHDPAVPMWAASLVPSGPRVRAAAIGGAGWTETEARAACIGEAIERYQPYSLPRDASIVASFDRWPLDERAVEPCEWVLFHREQYESCGFPFEPFTDATVCRWVCFREARSGSPMWVPEEIAYLYPRRDAEHSIGPAISTGLACGRVGDPVLLRGLQETIERDALMGAWWGAYPLEEWPSDEVFRLLGGEVERTVARPNLTYRFYRVDTPYSAHVTVVTMEGEDREGFCFSAGAACRESRDESLHKAVLEAIQGRHYVRCLKARLSSPVASSEPTDFSDHAVYFSLRPEELERTVLRRAASRGTHDATREPFGALAERLGSSRPVLFRAMTPPAAARAGFLVLKVLVPGLQPMHGNHRFPYLGGPLWTPRGLSAWSTVPPHPFP